MQISIEQLKLESTMGRTLAERAEIILTLNKQLGDTLTENAQLKAQVEQLRNQLDGLTKKSEAQG